MTHEEVKKIIVSKYRDRIDSSRFSDIFRISPSIPVLARPLPNFPQSDSVTEQRMYFISGVDIGEKKTNHNFFRVTKEDDNEAIYTDTFLSSWPINSSYEIVCFMEDILDSVLT